MDVKNIRFTELDIPRAIESYSPNLSPPISFFLPGQEMANWANKEVAKAKSNDRPFRPYLVPNLTETPWMPPECDHTASRTKWAAYSKKGKRALLPNEFGIQTFTLYPLRFISAADLCSALAKFGGLSPQLSHLSAVLHIGITESVGKALSYHMIIGAKLHGKARKREAIADAFVSLVASGNFQCEEQAEKEISLAAEADLKKSDRERGPKGKGKAGRKGGKMAC